MLNNYDNSKFQAETVETAEADENGDDENSQDAEHREYFLKE